MPIIDLDGLRIHYQQRGRGADVVLIHAVTSNMSVWLFSNLVDVLAQDFRVTAYDLRGHGASDAPANGYTSADMADDLQKLHGALKLGPAILVGHSFGGVVATHAAVLYPGIVRGIVLSDTFFPGLIHIEPDFSETESWREVRDALVAVGADLKRNVDFTRLFRVVADLSPDQRKQYAQMMGDPSLRWLSQLPRLAPTSCGRDVFDPAGLTADRICQLQQPVAALYDQHTSFRATQEFLATNLRNIRLETVPGARHIAPLQTSDAFVQLVQKHCRALSKAPNDANDLLGNPGVSCST